MAAPTAVSVVVSYSEKNKKVTLSKDDDPFAYLRKKVPHLFNLDLASVDFTFQKFDTDVDEFIDVERSSETDEFIEHKDKLKVMVHPKEKPMEVSLFAAARRSQLQLSSCTLYCPIVTKSH